MEWLRRERARKLDLLKRMSTFGVVLCITDQPSLSLLERVSSGCLPGYNPHISPGLSCQCQQKHSGCDQHAPSLQQWPDLWEWAELVLVYGCGGWGVLWKSWNKLQYPASHGFLKPADELISQLSCGCGLCQSGVRRHLQLPEHCWQYHTILELSCTASVPGPLASPGDPGWLWILDLSTFF